MIGRGQPSRPGASRASNSAVSQLPTAAILLAILIVAGCSGGLNSSGEGDGWTRAFEAGIPAFDLEVLPLATSDGIEIRIGVIPATLVSAAGTSGRVATFQYAIRIGDEVVLDRSDSLVFQSMDETRLFNRIVVIDTLDVVPSGPVQVDLQDLSSGQRARRTQSLVWTQAAGARLGRMALTRNGLPLVGIDLERGQGQLEAHLVVDAASPGCISWAVTDIPTDTSAAALPFSLTPSYGSREYRGALYDQADTVAVHLQEVDAGRRSLRLELAERDHLGVGRLLATWMPGCQSPEAESAAASRSYIVRPEAFPRINSLETMSRALTYIANQDEMARLEQASHPVALKEAFDAFWGRNLADPTAAARTLERYYTRVEEANRTFSDFKEGWKTDRGMIYIVMGPPLYQEDSIDELRWFYSYDERNAGRYFVFDRVQGYPDELEMPHYVLKRSMEQEREWRLAVTRWRSGRAR